MISSPPKIYEAAGGLRYDRRSLAVLFAWLLWGDFAFSFFESVLGRLLPLYLKELDASNLLIAVIGGSVTGVVNILFLPNISQWNDRLRTPWGRRIPLLLIATPLTVVSLVLIGFAPDIGRWIHGVSRTLAVPFPAEGALILGLLCGFVVAFHFFNMLLVNAYNWLLREVVPSELMGRFLSWFRAIGTLSSFIFLWFVFPYVLSHRRRSAWESGYFTWRRFLLMCWKVKEGNHPPPAEPPARHGALRSFLIYFRESFRIPVYWNFYIAAMLMTVAISGSGSFTTLFAKETISWEWTTWARSGHGRPRSASLSISQPAGCATGFSRSIWPPSGWFCTG